MIRKITIPTTIMPCKCGGSATIYYKACFYPVKPEYTIQCLRCGSYITKTIKRLTDDGKTRTKNNLIKEWNKIMAEGEKE